MAPSSSPLLHRSVSLWLRPIRTVTAFPAENWRIPARRMLEAYSRTWGGGGDILLPVDNHGNPRSDWLRILAAFDADVYATYQRSLRGRHLADPEGFEQWVDHECEKATAEGRSPEDLREFIFSDPEYRVPISNWRPAEPFIDFVEHWMSPGGHEGHIFSTVFTADAKVGGQAGVTDLADLHQEPKQIWTLTATDLPDDVQLLLDMRLGAVAPQFRDDMTKAGVGFVDVTAGPDSLSVMLELAWTGSSRSSAGWAEALAQVGEMAMGYDPEVVRSEVHEKSPFKAGLMGCSWVARSSTEWRNRPIIIVAGDAADDFALAMALDRGWGNGIWFPSVLLDDAFRSTALSTLGSAVMDRVRSGQVSTPLVVTSASHGPAANNLLDALTESIWAGRLPELTVADADRLELSEPRRLADLAHLNEIRTEPFLGPDHAGSLNPPLRPSLAQAREDPYACQWMVDVIVDGHKTPDRQVLKHLVRHGDAWAVDSVRPTVSGLAAKSHSDGFVSAGATFEQMLQRHRLRTPPAEEIFTALLNRSGYHLESSIAGRYTREALNRWGGLDEAVATLSDTDLYRILHVFTDSRGKTNLPKDKFLPGTIVRRRRFMTIRDMASVAQIEPADLITRADALVVQGILRRGFLLKCSRCSLDDWYPFGSFSQSFQCARCGADQLLSSASWRHPEEEPMVYYDLDEIVFQLLDNDGAVVLLALAQLRDDSTSFSFIPESDVIDEDGRLVGEVDLLAVADGDIVIGEAKRGKRLSNKSGKRDDKVANTLCEMAAAASADRLVLATASDAWAESTLERVNESLRQGLTQVVTITNVAERRPEPLSSDSTTELGDGDNEDQ